MMRVGIHEEFLVCLVVQRITDEHEYLLLRALGCHTQNKTKSV